MKKTVLIMMCAILCFSLVGCAHNSNNEQTEKTREILMKVLKNEQTFVAKTSVISDDITEQKIENYHFQTPDTAYYAFVPELYTFVDCDTDQIDELVILDIKRSCYLILRYDGQKIYGYNYTLIGDIKKFKDDGSFEPRLKDGEKKISRFLFDDANFEIVEKAYINEIEKIYLLDGQVKEPDTVMNFFNTWNNTPQAVWISISP